MSGELESLPASYLDASFIGQQVLVPGSASQPTVAGVLSDVAVFRPGVHARLVSCPSGNAHLELVAVAVPLIQIFLDGRCVSLRPDQIVLVEPAASPVDRP